MSEPDLYLLDIGCQQCKSRQCSRTYGKSLAGSRRGISKGVEHVSLLADFRIEAAHLCVSSGIVGNWTVCICSKSDSESGKHSDRSDADSVKAVAYQGRVK